VPRAQRRHARTIRSAGGGRRALIFFADSPLAGRLEHPPPAVRHLDTNWAPLTTAVRRAQSPNYSRDSTLFHYTHLQNAPRRRVTCGTATPLDRPVGAQLRFSHTNTTLLYPLPAGRDWTASVLFFCYAHVSHSVGAFSSNLAMPRGRCTIQNRPLFRGTHTACRRRVRAAPILRRYVTPRIACHSTRGGRGHAPTIRWFAWAWKRAQRGAGDRLTIYSYYRWRWLGLPTYAPRTVPDRCLPVSTNTVYLYSPT